MLDVQQVVVTHVRGGMVLCFLSSLVLTGGTLLLVKEKIFHK
jgi:hypothetical protein